MPGRFLTTLSFQARPFYERFGYEVFGELPDHPAGHILYIMKNSGRSRNERGASLG